jgi:hypothetical protein
LLIWHVLQSNLFTYHLRGAPWLLTGLLNSDINSAAKLWIPFPTIAHTRCHSTKIHTRGRVQKALKYACFSQFLGVASHISGLTPSKRMSQSKEWQKMLRGDLYWAWDEDLQANRTRCKQACDDFNAAGAATRRRKVELWRK